MYAEAVRFLEVRYRRPGIQGGDPLPEVQFSCPFTGERLRRYGVPTWLGVSHVRQDPGAFTAYVRAKEAAGEWTDSADTVTGDQLREALSEMPAGDDGRAWLESALSRRGGGGPSGAWRTGEGIWPAGQGLVSTATIANWGTP